MELSYYNLRFRLGIFHNCSLKGGKRTIFYQISNLAFSDTGSNLLLYDHKSNIKPLSYRTNNENSRSNSLLTFKCELLFQMTVQLYLSLFTFTIGFIPMSIKRLVFDYKPVSSKKLAHVRGRVMKNKHLG